MNLRRSARLSQGQLPTATPADLKAKVSNGVIPSESTASSTSTTSSASAASRKRKARTSISSKTKAGTTDPISTNSLPTAVSQDDAPKFAIPATPDRKRPKTKAPPVTPTPAAISIMNSSPLPFSSPSSHHTRPAAPHATNAPLQTPGGSRVLAYDSVSQADPAAEAVEVWENGVLESQLPKPTTTTENLLTEAEKHLISMDHTGKLKKIIEKFPCKMFTPEGLMEEVDPWRSLVSSIIGQQVSGAAAKSIKAKFISLFPSPPGAKNFFPSPAQVAVAEMPLLRSAGLSQRKAEYIQGLAEKFVTGELSARQLIAATDEEVLEKLTAVRGLGRWSVEMFACFTLKRMDVFSTGDLGVQRGMASYLGRDVSKLKAKGGKWKYLTEKEMLEHSAKFAPYRSLFMWYMWRVEDVDVAVLGGNASTSGK